MHTSDFRPEGRIWPAASLYVAHENFSMLLGKSDVHKLHLTEVCTLKAAARSQQMSVDAL